MEEALANPLKRKRSPELAPSESEGSPKSGSLASDSSATGAFEKPGRDADQGKLGERKEKATLL